MTGTAAIFFILFGLSILLTYMGVRRRWARPQAVTLVGAVAAILTMILFSLAQGTGAAQAIIVGFLVGSIFVAAVVSIARFFLSAEERGAQRPPADH